MGGGDLGFWYRWEEPEGSGDSRWTQGIGWSKVDARIVGVEVTTDLKFALAAKISLPI